MGFFNCQTKKISLINFIYYSFTHLYHSESKMAAFMRMCEFVMMQQRVIHLAGALLSHLPLLSNLHPIISLLLSSLSNPPALSLSPFLLLSFSFFAYSTQHTSNRYSVLWGRRERVLFFILSPSFTHSFFHFDSLYLHFHYLTLKLQNILYLMF